MSDTKNKKESFGCKEKKETTQVRVIRLVSPERRIFHFEEIATGKKAA